ncbi:MAG: CPBP family glutamic-type intramembrane protease [Pseudomonadota bacterium]
MSDDLDIAQSAPAPANVVEEWKRFGAFMRSPALPTGTQARGSAVLATLRILLLDLSVMAILIAALGAASAAGFELPENVNNSLGPNLFAVVLVVVLAPLMEELFFRSWLAGHPPIMAAIAICVVGFGGGALVATLIDPEGTMPALLIIGPAIALVAAPVSAVVLLKKPVPGFYKRLFPVFFWLSSLAFAMVHLANYTEGALWILLPLILPQLVLGTMLGYIRVHHGLIAAIAMHAMHNGLLFSLALLGKLAEDAGSAAALS